MKQCHERKAEGRNESVLGGMQTWQTFYLLLWRMGKTGFSFFFLLNWCMCGSRLHGAWNGASTHFIKNQFQLLEIRNSLILKPKLGKTSSTWFDFFFYCSSNLWIPSWPYSTLLSTFKTWTNWKRWDNIVFVVYIWKMPKYIQRAFRKQAAISVFRLQILGRSIRKKCSLSIQSSYYWLFFFFRCSLRMLLLAGKYSYF